MTRLVKADDHTTGSKLKQPVLLRNVLEDRNDIRDRSINRSERIRVRLLTALDIMALHSMYWLLSEESRGFFRPTFFEKISLRWLVANVALLISTVTSLKMLLMRLWPRAIVIPLIATNNRNDIIAFAYLNIEQRLAKGKYSAGFATCVRDDYQGRGLGSKLTRLAIELARREKVIEISLWVAAENYKAIGLYEKYGFKITRLVKRTPQYERRSYDYLKMSLHLS